MKVSKEQINDLYTFAKEVANIAEKSINDTDKMRLIEKELVRLNENYNKHNVTDVDRMKQRMNEIKDKHHY